MRKQAESVTILPKGSRLHQSDDVRNAPPEWLHVPEENIKGFNSLSVIKERMIKMPHWKSLNHISETASME